MFKLTATTQRSAIWNSYEGRVCKTQEGRRQGVIVWHASSPTRNTALRAGRKVVAKLKAEMNASQPQS